MASLDDNEFINDIIIKVESAKRIIDIVRANNCKYVNSYTNFIAIDCLRDDVYAKNILESLIKNGILLECHIHFHKIDV